ncbi:OmpA family protein [Flavobacterium sp. P4023]|uniref:OmpA family protein n=1 Tax=Flavobacterium flabelliforme TaxID=2816119 RepID=A0ABS5CTG8_9FLAO|nr:OmpA family protein [Flavobacterium flabelliforme]MBP4141914.1 OmpA family protein [Flavobacterium flabelliforme]
MKNNIFLYIIILNALTFNVYSQKAKLIAADKKYDKFAYIDAIKTYERVAEKGYKSTEMFKNLANSYYFNSDFEKAAKWYAELFDMNSTDLEPEYYYRYANSLKSIGQDEKANELLKLFDKKSGNDSRGKLFAKDRNYLEEIKANSGRYKIEDAGINSEYSDYGTAIYNNEIVFTSARDTGSLGQRKHKWTNQHFTNLYSATLGEDMTPNKPKKFDSRINSRFNESTPVFTNDGQSMYFTRNNFLDGKKGKDGNKITLVKIYKATLKNQKWTDVIDLPFNSDNYSTAHPALSPDGKTLYFASDMPGSIGQSDLFKVEIKSNGTYGIPINLGTTINTEGKESFPYVSDENEIYFASDGHPGLGGLDVFVSTLASDGSFGEVQNLGSDINSSKDDFAYLIDTKSRRGFFSSNKEGGKGYDDIYKFLELKRLSCQQLLYGEITDTKTSSILAATKITLFDNKFNIVSSTQLDDKGNYSFNVQCGKTYYVRAEKSNYKTKEEKIAISTANGKTHLPIALENDKCIVTVGDDLGKCFNIKMIYFDLDKSSIRQEAAFELEKILDVLKQNPSLKLNIRSHTDSRQTAVYNMALSNRRASATIAWLIQNGINSNRLTGKGYGESQLVNNCSDNVICSEEEHQMNRRSEFIITAL